MVHPAVILKLGALAIIFAWPTFAAPVCQAEARLQARSEGSIRGGSNFNYLKSGKRKAEEEAESGETFNDAGPTGLPKVHYCSVRSVDKLLDTYHYGMTEEMKQKVADAAAKSLTQRGEEKKKKKIMDFCLYLRMAIDSDQLDFGRPLP